MHSLFLLQLIQAVLVAIQLVMIFSANRVKREWLTVGQLCIAVVILADLFSELIFLVILVSLLAAYYSSSYSYSQCFGNS